MDMQENRLVRDDNKEQFFNFLNSCFTVAGNQRGWPRRTGVETLTKCAQRTKSQFDNSLPTVEVQRLYYEVKRYVDSWIPREELKRVLTKWTTLNAEPGSQLATYLEIAIDTAIEAYDEYVREYE